MQTSDPAVYAAGDIAEHDGVIHGLWPVAVAQAEVAAAKRDNRRLAREPHPAIGKEETVSSLSDAEVIGRSLDQPEAFGLIYDRHAPSVLRFLGRRVGAEVAEGLPDGEREALLLFAWEDLSYQSVAEALELPIGTVRSRLNRARTQLRELLEPGGKKRKRSR